MKKFPNQFNYIVLYRQTFDHLGELLDQNKYIGDVAILNDGDRFIYNLVTKTFSQGKPKLRDVYLSLQKMRRHCEKNGIKNLSMPRIGCGLDRLEWDDVKKAIEEAFRGLDITITVHDYNPVSAIIQIYFVPHIREYSMPSNNPHTLILGEEILKNNKNGFN